MGEIVYWDGGEYLTPKAVTSVEIVVNRLNIDWGEGDREILLGSEAFISVQPPFRYANVSHGSGIFLSYKISRSGSLAMVKISTFFNTHPLSMLQGTTRNMYWVCEYGHPSYSPYRRVLCFSIFLYPIDIISYSDTPLYAELDNDDEGVTTTPDDQNAANFNGVTELRTVTTEILGQSSIRESNEDPNISELCAVAITYTDNSIYQIPLSYCPPWVRIRTDEECPEGTCSVECENHICCYDCSGKAVLVIPK